MKEDEPNEELNAKPSVPFYRRNLPHYQNGPNPLFVTFNTYQRWILPPEARKLVLRHCLHDNGRKLHMICCVIMPDHVHLLYRPMADTQDWRFSLKEVMGGIKGASAHSINKLLGRKGTVWQDESFDHKLRREVSIEAKADYICNNPVRWGLASTPDEYPFLWRWWVEGKDEGGG